MLQTFLRNTAVISLPEQWLNLITGVLAVGFVLLLITVKREGLARHRLPYTEFGALYAILTIASVVVALVATARECGSILTTSTETCDIDRGKPVGGRGRFRVLKLLAGAQYVVLTWHMALLIGAMVNAERLFRPKFFRGAHVALTIGDVIVLAITLGVDAGPSVEYIDVPRFNLVLYVLETIHALLLIFWFVYAAAANNVRLRPAVKVVVGGVLGLIWLQQVTGMDALARAWNAFNDAKVDDWHTVVSDGFFIWDHVATMLTTLALVVIGVMLSIKKADKNRVDETEMGLQSVGSSPTREASGVEAPGPRSAGTAQDVGADESAA